MQGGGGNDAALEGARGDDELHGAPNTMADQDLSYATTGEDKLYGEDGPGYVEGQEGSDLMSGAAGDDRFDAAYGDTVNAPDTVRCGSGTDEVTANDNDIVADNCENVTREANPR